MTHVCACSFNPLNDALRVPLEPGTDTFVVSVPVIINTQPIQMNTEVILKASQSDNQKKHKAPPTATAFDQLAKQEKKKRKPASAVVD